MQSFFVISCVLEIVCPYHFLCFFNSTLFVFKRSIQENRIWAIAKKVTNYIVHIFFSISIWSLNTNSHIYVTKCKSYGDRQMDWQYGPKLMTDDIQTVCENLQKAGVHATVTLCPSLYTARGGRTTGVTLTFTLCDLSMSDLWLCDLWSPDLTAK